MGTNFDYSATLIIFPCEVVKPIDLHMRIVVSFQILDDVSQRHCGTTCLISTRS